MRNTRQPGMVIPALGRQGEEECLSSSPGTTVQGDLVPRKQGPPGTLQRKLPPQKFPFQAQEMYFWPLLGGETLKSADSHKNMTASKCMCFHLFLTLFCFAVTGSPVVKGSGPLLSLPLASTYWNYRWMPEQLALVFVFSTFYQRAYINFITKIKSNFPT